jgi:pyruvate,orthophosphate dikinase
MAEAVSSTALLQLLRLKGRASEAALVAALDDDRATVGAALAALVAAGQAEAGPRDTYRLTPAGRDALGELLAAERAGVDRAAVRARYDEFCIHNEAFKAAMTDWQLKDACTPNDHTDQVYDDAVVARIGEIHAVAVPVITAAVGPVERLAAWYPRRLEAAWRRVLAGDRSWIAKPLADSYHTVWFELHEELIGLAGLSRADEAVAGRGG